MEEIEHISFEKANKDFESNFGCTDCKLYSPSVSVEKEGVSPEIIGIISAVIIIIAVGAFIALRFF